MLLWQGAGVTAAHHPLETLPPNRFQQGQGKYP